MLKRVMFEADMFSVIIGALYVKGDYGFRQMFL
jgi:hypothetical protein